MSSRPFLAMALILMVACGSLQTHARVAEYSAQSIDAIGAAMEAEAESDKEHARGQCQGDRECVQQKYNILRTTYTPILESYEMLRAAHEKYVEAIRQARKNSESRLGESYVRGMLEAWYRVMADGEHIGVPVPSPPKELVRAAGAHDAY